MEPRDSYIRDYAKDALRRAEERFASGTQAERDFAFGQLVAALSHVIDRLTPAQQPTQAGGSTP